MIKNISPIICIITACFIVASCGPSNKIPAGNKYIRINEPARKDNFTNEQLRNYLRKNDAPAIIVRGTGATGSISAASNTERICALLEYGLAKNHFDVRDRSLFENIATAKDGLRMTSYEDLYEATHVDLLMEVTSYSLTDYYSVDGYYDEMNKFYRFVHTEGKTISYPSYLFRGMSISIKVTILKDNLVGGTYSYSYVPCSEESGGALITQLYPLRYRPASEARDIDAILNDTNVSGKLESQNSRLDRTLENFITNVVVPGMMQDIRGYSHNNTEMDNPAENAGEIPIRIVSPTNNQQSMQQQSRGNEPKKQSRQPSRGNELNRQSEKILTDNPEDMDEVRKICDLYDRREIYNIVLSMDNPDKTQDLKFRPQNYLLAYEMLLGPAARKNLEALVETKSKLRNISARNSFGQLSDAVKTLTESKFYEQDDKTAKKKKGGSAIASTLDKFLGLNPSNLDEICKFVSMSCSNVGLEQPEYGNDYITLFLPTPLTPHKEDYSILLFLDKECVGAGTRNKGFYSCIENTLYDNSFHELTLVGISHKSMETVRLYQSTVQFGLKLNYIFSQKDQYKLTELTLE